MAETPEELGEETVVAADGAPCRDPERLRRLGQAIGELLCGDPEQAFLTIAVVATYPCHRHGSKADVHAVTGLVTAALKEHGHGDLRLLVQRMRQFADETAVNFPAPRGELPYERRS